MIIDERALGIALESLSNCAPEAGFGNLARSLIEAYEAALWRPIEEAPMHEPLLLQLSSGRLLVGKFSTEPAFGQFDARFDAGAMFRTIIPPPRAKS